MTAHAGMKRAIEKAYASIAEGQLHLRRRRGNEGAASLCLLHASPSSSRSLVPLMERFGPELAVYAFDTPCNGQSPSPVCTAPEVADFADMMARGAQALGLSRLALYGTHTGAHIAVEWALAQPRAIGALVIDGAALLDEAMRAEFLEHYAPRRTPDETGAQFHWAWNFIRDQMLFFPHYRKDEAHLRRGGSLDPHLLHELTLDVLGNLETYHLPYEAVFRHDLRARLVPGAKVARDCADPAAKAAAITAFLEETRLG